MFAEYEDKIRHILKKYYDNNMEKLDFHIGCALEKRYPGYQIPQTIYYVFTFQTQRRLEEDMVHRKIQFRILH